MRQLIKSLVTTGVVTLFITSAAAAEPALSGLRVQDLAFEEGIYISSSQLGTSYQPLVDVESPVPVERVLLQIRSADGSASPVMEGHFELTPTGPTTGTVTILASAHQRMLARDIDVWVEDLTGVASNRLTQRIVIRN